MRKPTSPSSPTNSSPRRRLIMESTIRKSPTNRKNFSPIRNISTKTHDFQNTTKNVTGTSSRPNSRSSVTSTNTATNSLATSSSNGQAAPSLQMFKECQKLLDEKQYRSCELLAQIHLSTLYSKSTNNIMLCNTLEILGDCNQAREQHHRAIQYYRQAVSTLRFDFPNGKENTLRLKESQSLLAIGDIIEASTTLERIPSNQRTLSTFMSLGKLYKMSGRTGNATQVYLEALRKNPYALEALEQLAILGGRKTDALSSVAVGLSSSSIMTSGGGKENGDSKKSTEMKALIPLQDIILSYFSYHKPSVSSSSCLSSWKKLDTEYPNNPEILLHMAYVHLQQQPVELNAAEQIFHRIRILDPSIVEGMDRYAVLLVNKKKYTDLEKLSLDLLDKNDKAKESWLSLGLYHLVKGDIDKSIAVVEKSISCTEGGKYAFGHKILGRILLKHERPQHAIVSFFRANEISKDIESYEGLVESYLAANKFKEAIGAAKEAISFAPRDARAMTLVGLALSKAPAISIKYGKEQGRDRAKKALIKALALDGSSLRAVVALVDLYIQDEEYDNCIDLLMRSIADSSVMCNPGDAAFMFNLNSGSSIKDNQVILYTKLAFVHTLSKNYSEALSCYHIALSLNPDSMDAQQGMERLEKIMRGIDPNSSLPNDDDEYEYNDEEIYG